MLEIENIMLNEEETKIEKEKIEIRKRANELEV